VREADLPPRGILPRCTVVAIGEEASMTVEDRTSFGDRKVYSVPERWEDLRGPAHGLLEMPVTLHWVRDRRIRLEEPGELRMGYRAVICEGLAEDQERYLNPDLLRSIWADMVLPPRVRSLWRARFPEHLPENSPGVL
jgi:hypothetical protein